MRAATQNFNTKIGEGGFGPVYYGKLADGQEVAIKVLDINSHQGAQEFYNEVCLNISFPPSPHPQLYHCFYKSYMSIIVSKFVFCFKLFIHVDLEIILGMTSSLFYLN